jgi:AraC-like DNA-binding protein
VRCFWFLRAEDLGGAPQTIVADGRLEIILHLGNAFQRLDDHGIARAQERALVSGQLTSPIRLRSNGAADIVGIRFRTAAASVFFRTPLAELNDRVESLDHVSRRLARNLFDAAARQHTPQLRAAALARVLERSVSGDFDQLASHIVTSLDTPNAPQVAAVAARYGVSARTIERRVQDSTGLSLLRRVLRFRRAFRELDQSPPGTWATVAARTGYYDQAHLIRDFRQFAGVAPTEFFGLDPELARSIMSGEPV